MKPAEILRLDRKINEVCALGPAFPGLLRDREPQIGLWVTARKHRERNRASGVVQGLLFPSSLQSILSPTPTPPLKLSSFLYSKAF